MHFLSNKVERMDEQGTKKFDNRVGYEREISRHIKWYMTELNGF